MKIGIVLAVFGNREHQVKRLYNNIRSYCDYPVIAMSDRDFKVGDIQVVRVRPMWIGHTRYGVRNNNYFQAVAAYTGLFDLTLCLDDDMYIVSDQFEEGFDLAEKFGCCLPHNPRIYVKYNNQGVDVENISDLLSKAPQVAPACNSSPMFYNNHHEGARAFLKEYLRLQTKTPGRGTSLLWLASWRSGFTPLYLPEQWCVCQTNAEYIKNYRKVLKGKEVNIEPIILHIGHRKVADVFGIE